MKKKGFTLIELLAVIVILVVIALIATPIVINIIEKSKKSAFEDSVYGVMEAAKLKYTENILDGKNIEQTYLIEDGLRELEYSGKVDGRGVLKIDKTGKIELAIYNDKWCIRKSKEESKLEVEEYKDKCIIPGIERDPVITLNGEARITLKSGESYEEQGAIAKTVEGKELEYITVITLNDTIVESVDTNQTGTYKITYSTSSNGKSMSVTRVVIVEVDRADKTGANPPNLSNGLIPIKWNGSSWEKADSNNFITNPWYKYEIGMWANGASVTEEYRNVEVGTVIPEEAIFAYFVWIPRYEYDYTNLGEQHAGGTRTEPGEIKINFIKGTSKTATTNYMIHPAFTFGEQELEGIWVGKFETTGDGITPTIKPNLASLTNQNVSTEFATAQKFSASGNVYGINTSADSHMMKNSEWGAVAYLSQSQYGKYGNANYTGANKEVYINNNSNFITGCSAGSPSESYSFTCVYTYEKENTGTGASTTGTIYGVYDMSGGVWEYVMGVYRGSDAASEWGASINSNYAGFGSVPASKYYDEYTSNVVCSGGICYGHALNETMSWYADLYAYIGSNNPWYLRGGGSSGTTNAGVFASDLTNGASKSYYSFRVVLR